MEDKKTWGFIVGTQIAETSVAKTEIGLYFSWENDESKGSLSTHYETPSRMTDNHII